MLPPRLHTEVSVTSGPASDDGIVMAVCLHGYVDMIAPLWTTGRTLGPEVHFRILHRLQEAPKHSLEAALANPPASGTHRYKCSW